MATCIRGARRPGGRPHGGGSDHRPRRMQQACTTRDRVDGRLATGCPIARPAAAPLVLGAGSGRPSSRKRRITFWDEPSSVNWLNMSALVAASVRRGPARRVRLPDGSARGQAPCQARVQSWRSRPAAERSCSSGSLASLTSLPAEEEAVIVVVGLIHPSPSARSAPRTAARARGSGTPARVVARQSARPPYAKTTPPSERRSSPRLAELSRLPSAVSARKLEIDDSGMWLCAEPSAPACSTRASWFCSWLSWWRWIRRGPAGGTETLPRSSWRRAVTTSGLRSTMVTSLLEKFWSMVCAAVPGPGGQGAPESAAGRRGQSPGLVGVVGTGEFGPVPGAGRNRAASLGTWWVMSAAYSGGMAVLWTKRWRRCYHSQQGAVNLNLRAGMVRRVGTSCPAGWRSRGRGA